MADLARIKKNVAKMAAMNAPESDIDGYIASEGVTIDDVKNYQSTPDNVLGAVTTFDKGYTGGFGRKLGGVINALGAGAVDANIETLKPILNAFGANISDDVKNKEFSQAFADRYNEIVDPALKASEKFEEANPITALALNIGGAIASPVNKLGMGYIGKGATNLDKLVRSGVVGAGTGALYGAGRTENLEDLTSNVNEDAQMGGALGLVLPPALQGAKGFINKLNPKRALADKATGLNNIVKDGDSVKMLKRGIQADDAIASQVKEEAPAAMNSLNERMREALNRLTGRKLDIEQANVNQKGRYDRFIGQNADRELLDFAPTREQLAAYTAESKYNPNKNYTRADATSALEKRASNLGVDLYNNVDDLKQAQLDLINSSNPMLDDYHTGIRSLKDIKTWNEAIDDADSFVWGDFSREQAQQALKSGKVKVYSSKPIKEGGFVSTSKNQAMDYAGGGKVYEQEVPLQDVAWINGDEGQYAPVDKGKGYFLKRDDRLPVSRTLENTVKNPDITFTQGNKGYVVKKYDANGKPFFDFIAQKEGKIYNKFPTDEGYVDNQLKKSAQNVSLSGRVSEGNAGLIHNLPSETTNIIPNQKVVVNKNLPRLSAYTDGLNEFQKDALNQALSKGAYMSTNAKGTLGATHRGQEVLNDMIEASYNTSIIGQKKPTTETRQLMQVKERLNQILEPSGIKPYDAGLSKAKALQDAYEKGYKFKPSETKFDALGLEKARDKRAFLQGRIASILDNVKDDKNIAKAIQADENTLRKLMPEGKYKQLLKDANNISTEYERVRSLANQAEKQVVKPEAIDRPISEKIETKPSAVGSLIDKLNKILMSESNKRAANILLGNEKAVDSKLLKAIGRVPEYSLTPYFVDVLSSNK